MKEIKVTKNEEGYKLRKLCMNYLSEAPTSFIYKMLRKKNIVLNDKKATGDEVVKSGDSVKFYLSDETIDKFKKKNTGLSNTTSNVSSVKANIKLDVVYEDDDYIFCNKPAGVLSQKAKPGDYSINEAIIDYLLENGSISKTSLETYKPSICNRLDRNTSGLILAAKTPAGAHYLTKVIRERLIDKYYLTVVPGDCELSGIYKAYISKNEKENLVTVTENQTKDSKPIETGIEVIGYNDDLDLSLLRIKLITGKSHQIRAHLAHLGYPILGDYKYGVTLLNGIFNRKYGVKSQMLTAYRVDMDGKRYVARPPKEFYKFFKLQEI